MTVRGNIVLSLLFVVVLGDENGKGRDTSLKKKITNHYEKKRRFSSGILNSSIYQGYDTEKSNYKNVQKEN